MIFDRVVCGVDGSPESIEAARQAARLSPPESEVILAEVVNPGEIAPAGVAVTGSMTELKRSAEEILGQARADVAPAHSASVRLLEGPPIPTLLEFVESNEATLLAVGMRRHSRAAGIALGSMATAALHEAPASVLVARRPARPEDVPRSFAVAFDGSEYAERALGVARELAERLGGELRVVCATGGKGMDVTVARERLHGQPAVAVVEDDRHPVDALVAIEADLLITGSRGLHGVRALGSVSERVAHHAPCSVLVVR